MSRSIVAVVAGKEALGAIGAAAASVAASSGLDESSPLKKARSDTGCRPPAFIKRARSL